MPLPDRRALPCPVRALTVILACVLISACASRPTPEPSPPQVVQPPPLDPEEATPPKPTPEPDVQPDPTPEPEPRPCAWSNTRGIAKLLAIDEPPGRQGTWQFFPGDDVVFHPAPASASPGDEFKALLRRPMSGDCKEPELVLFGPV